MQKRNVLNSPRLTELKKHRQRSVLKKIFTSFFGVVVIFILLAYLSRIKALNISSIEVVGNQVVDAQMITEAVKEQNAGKYLWLFPKSNILLYSEDNIKHQLWNKFKRLKDINLSIKDGTILVVSVTERAGKYIWCGINPPQADTQNQSCYFMDENGYIFDGAPYFSGEVYFKFYGGDVLDANPLGSYFSSSVNSSLSSSQNFKQLISFKDVLIDMGLKPVALYTTESGDIQIFLSLPSGGASITTNPKIILRSDADFQNVAENLQAALTTEPLQSKFQNNYSKLEYIDLRFENKVYDKFQ